MPGWSIGFALFAVALFVASPVAAQETPAPPAEEAVPPATGPVTLSQTIRNAGYTLTPEEVAYLDADEQVNDRFLRVMLAIDLTAEMVNEPAVRQVLLDSLRQVNELDPSATPVQPPASMQTLHQLGQTRREAIQVASRQWIEGLEANDPYWMNRGAEALGRARQAEADWLTTLRNHLASTAPQQVQQQSQQPAPPTQSQQTPR